MKLQPVSAEHLKINTPRWKLVLGFFKPNLNPVSISVIAIVLFMVLFVSLNLYPKQSTRDYEAAATDTRELEFSDMKLAAYDGIKFSIGYRTANGRGGRNYSSKTGGVVIRGNIRNTSDRELFLTVGYPPNSIRTGDRLGVRLYVNGRNVGQRAQIKITGSTYSRGGSVGEFAGHYLKPAQKLGFELISKDVEIDSEDTFEIEIDWIVLDTESLETRPTRPALVFQRNGSSRVWGDGGIQWRVTSPVYRKN